MIYPSNEPELALDTSAFALLLHFRPVRSVSDDQVYYFSSVSEHLFRRLNEVK